MARGRMISKSLSTSRKYGKLYAEPLGEFCQALYPLLIAHADDFGRMDSDPYTIKHAVVPASPRTESEISQALTLLQTVGLVACLNGTLQLVDFDRHQSGIHHRTLSKFPDILGNFPEIQEIPGKNVTEYNLTEENLTKENSTRTELEQNRSDGSSGKVPEIPGNRSKRPIFQGQRFVVFEWQLNNLTRMLGSHTDDFDLHSWFFELDARATANDEIVNQRDGGKWLESQTMAEAQRRGLPIATAPQILSDVGKQNLANARGAVAHILGRKP